MPFLYGNRFCTEPVSERLSVHLDRYNEALTWATILIRVFRDSFYLASIHCGLCILLSVD